MRTTFPFTFLIFFLALSGYSQSHNPINDGPYIFIEDNFLVEKNVVDGKLKIDTLPINSYPTSYESAPDILEGVHKLAVLSDVHGQYDLFIELLSNNNIIDSDRNWSFGNGHLVIVGDIFDRGEKVTEILWLIYKLEQQARKKGGNLHYLLGNHEYMVLRNDLRYIHQKYRQVSEIIDIGYDKLFSYETVLGRWLRSKATIIKIDDKVFVHGGLSPEFLSKEYSIPYVNEIMRLSIDVPKDDLEEDGFYETYYRSLGPIWYRGYFNEEFDMGTMDLVLQMTDSKHVFVGHTTHKEVVSLFENKLFCVDSNIKGGESGEILIIEGTEFSVFDRKGNKQ